MEDVMKDYMKQLKSQLLNRKIIAIRYMTDAEAHKFGWFKRPLVIQLDDNTFIIPQSDDEGNDGGAMALINGQTFNVIPTT